jgi:hypothetical protein
MNPEPTHGALGLGGKIADTNGDWAVSRRFGLLATGVIVTRAWSLA